MNRSAIVVTSQVHVFVRVETHGTIGRLGPCPDAVYSEAVWTGETARGVPCHLKEATSVEHVTAQSQFHRPYDVSLFICPYNNKKGEKYNMVIRK